MRIFRRPNDDEEIVIVGECDCGAMADRCICNTKIVKKSEVLNSGEGEAVQRP